jgi:hypothetical protein
MSADPPSLSTNFEQPLPYEGYQALEKLSCQPGSTRIRRAFLSSTSISIGFLSSYPWPPLTLADDSLSFFCALSVRFHSRRFVHFFPLETGASGAVPSLNLNTREYARKYTSFLWLVVGQVPDAASIRASQLPWDGPAETYRDRERPVG